MQPGPRGPRSKESLTPALLNVLSYRPEIPAPTLEWRFDQGRRGKRRLWRFDAAWIVERVAVELEGGIWDEGRHTRGAGYLADLVKYNAATAQGWRVLRYSGECLEGRPVQVAEEILAVLNLARGLHGT